MNVSLIIQAWRLDHAVELVAVARRVVAPAPTMRRSAADELVHRRPATSCKGAAERGGPERGGLVQGRRRARRTRARAQRSEVDRGQIPSETADRSRIERTMWIQLQPWTIFFVNIVIYYKYFSCNIIVAGSRPDFFLFYQINSSGAPSTQCAIANEYIVAHSMDTMRHC
jgi:hypothetical protein